MIYEDPKGEETLSLGVKFLEREINIIQQAVATETYSKNQGTFSMARWNGKGEEKERRTGRFISISKRGQKDGKIVNSKSLNKGTNILLALQPITLSFCSLLVITCYNMAFQNLHWTCSPRKLENFNWNLFAHFSYISLIFFSSSCHMNQKRLASGSLMSLCYP